MTGRTVKVTDNVSGEQLVGSNPAARTVQTDTYSLGRDPAGHHHPGREGPPPPSTCWGLRVKVVHPDGLTQAESYNDVANVQKKVSLVPSGAPLTAPVLVATNGFNDLNEPVSSAVSYSDKTPQAPAAESYDGLGRVTSYTANDVTATPHYSGTGGLQNQYHPDPRGHGRLGPAGPGGDREHHDRRADHQDLGRAGQDREGEEAGCRSGLPGTTYAYDAAGRFSPPPPPMAPSPVTPTPRPGRSATITQPSGTMTTYTYDPKTGGLAEVDVKGADGRTQQTGYTYDQASGRVKTVYDPAHPADAIDYKYDADGHMIEVDYPDGTTTKAGYDDNGELATTTDITGAVTSYTYNANGTCGPARTDLCSATQIRGGTTLAKVAYTYDSLDRVHTVTRGNGVTTTLDYTDASQVENETVKGADGTVLRTDSYTYDSHGNIATHTINSALPAPGQATRRTAGHGQDAAASQRRKGASPATTTAYSYDAYNRLISSALYPSATATGTPTTTTSYTVDRPATSPCRTSPPGGDHAHGEYDQPGRGTDQPNSRRHRQAEVRRRRQCDQGPDRQQLHLESGRRAGIGDHRGRGRHDVHVLARPHPAHRHHHGERRRTRGHLPLRHQRQDRQRHLHRPRRSHRHRLVPASRQPRTRTLLNTTGTGPGTAQTTGPGTGYYLTDAHGSVTAMIDTSGTVTAS